MSSLPLISVIIPTYNVGGYVSRCLDSVLAQTYFNIEVIVVDDGSTDDTLAHLQSYAEKYAQIRVITQPNGGVSAARNRGLDEANGAYVFFLDGDDLLLPDALARLYESCNGADVVQGVHESVDENGIVETVAVEDACLTDANAILTAYFHNQIQESSCNKLFCRESIGDVRFDPTLAVAEDSKFVYTVLKQVKCVRLISAVTYQYVLRADSCVHAAVADKHFGVLTLCDAQYDEVRHNREQRRAFACKYVQDVFHLIHCVLQDERGAYMHRLPMLRRRIVRAKWMLLFNHGISAKLKIGVMMLWLTPPLFYRTYRKIRAV